MKRLIGILTMAAAVNFTVSQPAPAEDGASAKTSGKDRIVREQVASTVKAAGEYVKTEFDNI
ncbi:MAG: hypothetical protein LBJ47_04430, partial [Tannerella sp.]|nr:hypothetical protein [Tannerella sp.]